MSVIEDVKSRIDIVELVSETVKLRRSGRAFTGLCPFHAHKHNTPSFAVWPESGTWKCFGQCNDGGDVFKFVMKRDGVDFGEALRLLAARAGVELKPRETQTEARAEENARLRQLLETAATYYNHLLKNAAAAQIARDHLAKRGLTDKAVEMFQLGYALDSWDAGIKYFSEKGYSRQELLDAGLAVEKEDNGDQKFFDRFRGRLMIPVRDEQGRMAGFQARALQADSIPKFMNSPQTVLFDKGRLLFGLHLARRAIREAGAAVVVEGNLDVIAAHQAGFANVVSSQGTALTEHQLRLLKRFAKRIILALDADEAGDAATLRGLQVAHETLDREAEVVFDPHGLVRIEGRLGTDIRVLTLPRGQDPDEVINRDPAEWQRLVEAAEPVVAYVIRVLTAGRNLNDPKVKTEIAAAVLPLIDDIAQPVEREAYRQQLARLLRIDERALAVKRPAQRRRAAEPPAAAAEPVVVAARARETAGRERYCLGTLLQRPELLYKVDRELQALNLPRLSQDDFTDTGLKLLFTALETALEQVELDPYDYWRANLEPEVAALAETVLAEGESPQTDEAGTVTALVAAVLRLRRAQARLWLNELRFLAEAAREQGDIRAEQYQTDISRQAQMLALMDRALVGKK